MMATLIGRFSVFLALTLASATAASAQTSPPATTPLTGTEVVTCVQSSSPRSCLTSSIGATITQSANTWSGIQTFPAVNTSGQNTFNSAGPTWGRYTSTFPGTFVNMNSYSLTDLFANNTSAQPNAMLSAISVPAIEGPPVSHSA